MSNDRIEVKVDKIQEDVNDIKVILERNTSSLEYHIKRTDAAEERLEIIQSELEPIKDHVKRVNWTLILLGTIGTIILGIAKLIDYIN